MTKKKSVFALLTKWERLLWLLSVLAVVATFLIFQSKDVLSLIASLIGVSALIFVAKGHLLGQILTVVFAIFYGIISFYFQYYGEVITYLGMTAPMAIVALISWFRHPFKDTQEVEVVSKLSKKQTLWMWILTLLITALFYFILGWLGNANLAVSTVSITTSFLAVYLTACRSPYYALAYAANDIVLIILWIFAARVEIGSVPMVACFAMFLANDLYGFFNWKRMEKWQRQ